MSSTTTTGKSRAKAAPRKTPAMQAACSSEDLAERIAVAAYFKAQARGFAPGGELDDWLQAEAEFGPRA